MYARFRPDLFFFLFLLLFFFYYGEMKLRISMLKGHSSKTAKWIWFWQSSKVVQKRTREISISFCTLLLVQFSFCSGSGLIVWLLKSLKVGTLFGNLWKQPVEFVNSYTPLCRGFQICVSSFVLFDRLILVWTYLVMHVKWK